MRTTEKRTKRKLVCLRNFKEGTEKSWDGGKDVTPILTKECVQTDLRFHDFIKALTNLDVTKLRILFYDLLRLRDPSHLKNIHLKRNKSNDSIIEYA